MYLEKIDLHNFRNYSEASLEFGAGVQCLLGKNGSGKTNLLDAIYYLSFTKSSLSATDTQNVRTGEPMFLVRGIFNKSAKPREVVCSFEIGHKKVMRENGVDCFRLSEHIGKYPAVLIAPNDIELIWNGGEIRRKFFDSLICQINTEYLQNLITYTTHLKMRNAMLRHFSEKGKVDDDLLESCDHKLIPSGIYVAKTRRAFVDEFTPVFQGHYGFLSKETAEAASIQYKTELDEFPLSELWKRNLQRDILLQRTSGGIHRDDFIFSLNGFELKRFGSQGQQKSFLIGLKLAEFDTITKKKGFKPILLLDDIFDKLDDERIARLIDLVGGGAFGQLFLTDARPDRSRDLLAKAGIGSEMFLVENGNLTKS